MARTKQFRDITGQRFGKYVVLSHVAGQRWNCRCDCGTEKVIISHNLLTGQASMCRKCYQTSRIIDLAGQRFGKWTAISLDRIGYWNCRCDCGIESSVAITNLRSGGSTQCETCRLDSIHKPKHGHSPQGKWSITYQVWVSIKQRCGTQFSPYGGTGVSICQGWKSDFSNFLASMGERPSTDVSIDRENKNEATRHYSCGHCEECRKHGWIFHCRWATQGEQMRNVSTNRWLTHNGQTLTITDWGKVTGIARNTIKSRIDVHGWSIEKALDTPARKRQNR